MDKAYDLKVLGKRLEDKGVKLGKETLEEGAKVIIDELFPWLTESAMLSKNTIDDLAAPFYPVIHIHVKKLAENINKDDNV